MLPSIIPTPRLILRPFEQTDIEDVLLYATDLRWAEFLPVPQPYEREHAIEFLVRQLAEDRSISPAWAITADSRVIGGINVSFDRHHRRGTLGYSLSPAWWGRGLVTEAAAAVMDLSFETYDWLNKLSADADAENGGSLRVMDKLGMKREGVLRQHRVTHGRVVDVVTCGIVREEWERRA